MKYIMPGSVNDINLHAVASKSVFKPDFHRDVHCILGLIFDRTSTQEIVDKIIQSTTTGSRFIFATPNLNFSITALNDLHFRQSVFVSNYSIPDGMPIILCAQLMGIPIHQRVAGSDVFDHLRNTPITENERRLRVYFFGGMDGVAEKASKYINAQQGRLECVGHQSPGFGSLDELSTAAYLDPINASQPDFLIISLGARKGQAWIERNKRDINAPVMSHLGAVVNFSAGTVSRAPIFFQNTGLEWAWRILQEPVLWRRYARDGVGFLRILLTRVLPCHFATRKYQPTTKELSGSKITGRQRGEYWHLQLTGSWTHANSAPMREALTQAVNSSCDISIDMTGVTYLDPAIAALLLLLKGFLMDTAKTLSIEGLVGLPKRQLRYYCCEHLLDPSC